MTGWGGTLASDAGQMALRLAGFLADPIPRLMPMAVDRLVPEILRPLLGHTAFRRSISATFHRAPENGILASLASALLAAPLEEQQRRVYAFALLPQARLETLLAALAAAIHAPRFRNAVLKPERKALHTLFGPELSRLATEEGLSLLAPLGALDDGTPFPETKAPGLSPDHPARSRAAQVFCALLARDSADAAALLWWRITGTTAPEWPTLTSRQVFCLSQLVNRTEART